MSPPPWAACITVSAAGRTAGATSGEERRLSGSVGLIADAATAEPPTSPIPMASAAVLKTAFFMAHLK
ncbi:hypothetical protein GCM10010278_79750 [Streptomyces melanogenes]|nr:hypothetical protein GCM10010278_79750 [Streptomyces melanogenes]